MKMTILQLDMEIKMQKSQSPTSTFQFVLRKSEMTKEDIVPLLPSHFSCKNIHPLALLEGDDDVRRPLLHLAHDLSHVKGIRKFLHDVVNYRLDLLLPVGHQ